jgi:hypothetical protein
MRFIVPSLVNSSVALGLVAISIIVVSLNTQEVGLQQNDVSTREDVELGGIPQPADLTSLLQGMNIHIERLHAHEHKSDIRHKLVTSVRQGKPELSEVDKAMAGAADGLDVSGNVGFAVLDSVRKIMRSTSNQYSAGAGSIALVIILVLIGCTCCFAWSMISYDKFGWTARGGSRNSPPPPDFMSPLVQQQQQQQRPSARASRLARLSYSDSQERDFASFTSSPPRGTPPGASLSVPTAGVDLTIPQSPQLPPLCPTLVMQGTEARFGIPMQEIAALTRDGCGDLTVVGLSTNPLLRAALKKIGSSRMLEISMPESNSVPRATLTPSSSVHAGTTSERSRTLEIHDMRGNLYGVLEMRTNGACYVIKDGQPILYIDGQAENLHLVLKSNAGVRLGDVRCSAEPFGGVDHVEIRIEPGIDTVLVLAVVLAVLLLSPYLSP